MVLRFLYGLEQKFGNSVDRLLQAIVDRFMMPYATDVIITGIIAYKVGQLRDGGATGDEVQRAITEYVADYKKVKEVLTTPE